MLVHRLTQVMQKVCGPCSGETKWTRHDVTHLPLDRHPRTAWQARLGYLAKVFPHFQAAGSFLPEKLIPEILLIDERSTLA